MHKQDRTLLARLGFRNVDRKNARHDLACQYLMQPEVAQRILDNWADGIPRTMRWQTGYQPHVTGELKRLTFERATIGMPINKGHGQYKTTVGFADVVYRYKCVYESSYNDVVESQFSPAAMLVEVRIEPCPLGDIVRQMALYREYFSSAAYYARHHPIVLVTAFDLVMDDVETLRVESIGHVRLGARFDAYYQRRKETGERANCLEI